MLLPCRVWFHSLSIGRHGLSHTWQEKLNLSAGGVVALLRFRLGGSHFFSDTFGLQCWSWKGSSARVQAQFNRGSGRYDFGPEVVFSAWREPNQILCGN
jgi:hypothetical protein